MLVQILVILLLHGLKLGLVFINGDVQISLYIDIHLRLLHLQRTSTLFRRFLQRYSWQKLDRQVSSVGLALRQRGVRLLFSISHG
jgi:hypothetical protein